MRRRERERERGDNRSGIKGKAETASDGPVSEMGREMGLRSEKKEE